MSPDAFQRTASQNPLWNYSVAIFNQAEAQDLLIELQQKYGLSVNWLLFCGWLGANGQFIKQDHISDLLPGCIEWQQQVLEPLRTQRQALKPIVDMGEDINRLRNTIKQAELEAEFCEQQWLLKLARQWGEQLNCGDRYVTSADLMYRSIDAYLKAVGLQQCKDMSQLLDRLVEKVSDLYERT